MAPLFTFAAPIGPPAPSPSLRVERYEFSNGEWHTHRHVDQVVALYLKPANVRHTVGSFGNARLLSLGPDLATVCQRERSESILWNGVASFLCVRVGDSALGEASRFLRGQERTEIRPSTTARDPRLTSLLHALEAERAQQYPCGRLFLDSVENALAAALIASHGGEARTLAPKTGGLAPFRLKRVLEFMEANIDETVSLESLAQVADLSVSHFAHQFQRTTNVSPHKYMLQLRIERGKALLGNQRLSILDVALAVGFESQQHFATVFRRINGMSPSAYRQKL